MAHADWNLEGEWLKCCTCAWGCPCDFNAKPTNGNCKGFLGMHIVNGRFDDTKLDDFKFLVIVHFSGTLHERNGEAQLVLDERATSEQRDALLNILTGKHSNEGTLFHIFSLIIAKMHKPIFATITFDFDKEARTARVVVPSVLESSTSPIMNPVTGAPHRIKVVMPEGFEHIEGEIASADV